MVEYELANRGLDYEPLAGAADDARFPWFLYWEIAWLVLHNDYRPGQRLLDLGGCSSLFSCYMASKGLDVVAVDLKEELVDLRTGRVHLRSSVPGPGLVAERDRAELPLAGLGKLAAGERLPDLYELRRVPNLEQRRLVDVPDRHLEVTGAELDVAALLDREDPAPRLLAGVAVLVRGGRRHRRAPRSRSDRRPAGSPRCTPPGTPRRPAPSRRTASRCRSPRPSRPRA